MGLTGMGHVWQHSAARGSEKLMLLAIADLIPDDKGVTEPSKGYLATKVGCTPGHAKKLIASLDARGELIVIEQGGQSTSSGNTNSYSLTYKTYEGGASRTPLKARNGARGGETDPRRGGETDPHKPKSKPKSKKITATAVQVLAIIKKVLSYFSWVRVWRSRCRWLLVQAYTRLIRPQQVAAFWNEFWNAAAEWARVNDNPGSAKKSTYKMAIEWRIAAVHFELGFDKLTDSEQGNIRRTGYLLRKVGVTLEDIQQVYNYCKRQKWGSDFKPTAMATHYSAYKKAERLRKRGKTRISGPDKNEQIIRERNMNGDTPVSAEKMGRDLARMKLRKAHG